ncbi:MAG: methyltransferase domain-containing protein [Ilumatobacteraceae bacterium]
MDRDEYERMSVAGETHWWYLATRTLLAQLAERHLDAMTPDFCSLDAAGGSGGTGSWLERFGPVVVSDLDVSALVSATERHSGIHPVVSNLNRLPHPADSFHVSLCVTALYHQWVADPQVVVDELSRVTRPGGLVVLMEPGVRRLRRGHDAVTLTARRFSRRDLGRLVERSGLELVHSTGAYTFLLPPAAVLAVIERGRSASDTGRNQGGLGGLLPVLARAERAVLRHASLPFGLSVIAIGRKPSPPPGDSTVHPCGVTRALSPVAIRP